MGKHGKLSPTYNSARVRRTLSVVAQCRRPHSLINGRGSDLYRVVRRGLGGGGTRGSDECVGVQI